MPTWVKYRQAKIMEAVISTAPRRQAALSGSASKSMPITTPPAGRKPPNQ